MSLADRLGPFTRGPVGCGVCLWIDQLDDSDRATFDEWIMSGGNISQLWRECRNDPVRPLQLQLPQFSKCVREHHRGGNQ
jgi:hypothetical protein